MKTSLFDASALGLFRRLTSAPTAPYHEKAVTAQALGWIKTHLGGRVEVRRHRGGVAVRYRGAGAGPSLALAAHLDHPAFALSRVTSRGAQALMQGGLPPHLLQGCAVEAFAAGARSNVPAARGVLGVRPGPDAAFPVTWTSAPPKNRVSFAILSLTPFKIEGDWLHSRSIDDLLGCAVSLEAMRRLINAQAKVNLTVLLHRAEEVGFVGALDLIRRGEVSLGDSILSIESSRELPGARPGRGPVIRLGDKATLFDPNLIVLLDESAAALKERGLACQRLRLTGGTCEATAYLAFGYEAAGVAVPLVNYHNGWGAKAIATERVRLSDIATCIELLEEAARRFPGATLRGVLRGRLEARRRKSGPRLSR